MTRPLSLEDLSGEEDFGKMGAGRKWRKEDTGKLLKHGRENGKEGAG